MREIHGHMQDEWCIHPPFFADIDDWLSHPFNWAHAREALIKSKEYVKKELYGKGSVLNDDGEEAALDVLGPAVEWGEEVGLVKGMAYAKKLLAQLARFERAKVSTARS